MTRFHRLRLLSVDGAERDRIAGLGEQQLRAAQQVDQLRAGQAVVGLATLDAELDQAAVPQAGQMLGDGRLRQPEQAGQIDDPGLALGQSGHDRQPRGVAQRPEQRHRRGHIGRTAIHRHAAMLTHVVDGLKTERGA